MEVLNIPKDTQFGEIAKVFLNQELKILTALLDGSALEHHMEDSYYLALSKLIYYEMRNVNNIIGTKTEEKIEEKHQNTA